MSKPDDHAVVGDGPAPPPPAPPASSASHETAAHLSGSMHSEERRGRNPRTTLWMGDLERDMGEAEIMDAFQVYGFTPTLVRVIQKVTRGRETSAGYCFISFATVEEATNALNHMNGQPIPSTQPTRIFYLNWACQQQTTHISSIYVGRLPPSIDSYQLMSHFRQYFSSLRGAKVIYDRNGSSSRGFGFLRFASARDAERCIERFNKREVFGKMITLSIAFPTRSKMRQTDTRRGGVPAPLDLRGMSSGGPMGPSSAPGSYSHMQSPYDYGVSYQGHGGAVGNMHSPYTPVYMASQPWSQYGFESSPYPTAQVPVQNTPQMYPVASYPVQPSPSSDMGMAALTEQMAQHRISGNIAASPVHHPTMFVYPSQQQAMVRSNFVYHVPQGEGQEHAAQAQVSATAASAMYGGAVTAQSAMAATAGRMMAHPSRPASVAHGIAPGARVDGRDGR
ncbi:hypothetical protein PTSG_01047 [Salpingoeca rosetta]|uniref:RRM domain-containing protein n=1 Tax=Salpingoeca rosetta (strain ATCC 50818 / BSB-021) TaxID=946362 RepID=F2TY88_SALR5|nr:uncharacterized protein PTSG_01047 [Salpingoeca rosetta]EGD76347.1 hypothetical protein PTSG_01047 [Salpingoeca rosetta]|eukprot:XP_004998522.1 hypothetical protein PTSG_01047 [Salpingoeca rosetta]